MRPRLVFAIAVAGIVAGLVAAAIFAVRPRTAAPAFEPVANPYERGIYASGIVESEQASGENVNVFPEVAGTVTEVLVREGQQVGRGAALVRIEDSVQRATAEQLEAQASAAHALLEALRAQPRAETLHVAVSQVAAAQAALRTSSDQLAKQQASYADDSRSVSQLALDDATNAVRVAEANLKVFQRQLELVKAGAWIYDIRNQEAQYTALSKSAASARALLAKYEIRAPTDGLVLALGVSVGSYASPQGTLDTYTQGARPIVVMGQAGDHLAVRVFVDEILISKLGSIEQLDATMYVRGTDVRVPLQFVRVQPLVSPKVELSNERTERVDLRVLPVIFRFAQPAGLRLFPGQLVDVYVRAR
ncbi:MAG TPA: biotin/lipoyl-binding protein [Myxococcota bacterium]|nr:biotin/lipoyl-binding protein [Myxococcota bacterium]